MKIGIVTFHWAVNYGAVLQAYALQDYLRGLGHDACLIDYKPYNRDHNLKNFVLNRKLLHPFQYVREALKDRLFEDFRRDYLVRTKRYGSLEELRQDPPLCDIYISGSDQVLHPRTLMRGERRPAPVYMLDFGSENILRAGYAVSFGCTAYPPEAAEVARKYINRFDLLSVREKTGAGVAESLGYNGRLWVVPDPTILAGASVYDRILSGVSGLSGKSGGNDVSEGGTATYLLHGKNSLNAVIEKDFGKTIPLNGCSIAQWIAGIRNASRLVTNSFHGTVFALLFHIPFVALLETGAAAGMNDRFTTLLSRLGLEGRILPDYDGRRAGEIFASGIDWTAVDSLMEDYAREGRDFISMLLSARG